MRIEALGTVTPIASVAIKPRVDSEIVGVHFGDGAMVKQGDLLFTLDSRAIEAQIRQVEGLLAGARANLEQAERDVARYTELVAKSATTLVTLQNARTQANIWRASVDANTAQLENLKVQLSYCTIRAPIAGRISMAAVKVGNFVRAADCADRHHHPDRAGLRHLRGSAAHSARSAPGARRRERHHRGDHSRRAAAGERPGHHDREHRRRADRHGDGARHHAERRRAAVARHAGHRAADVARGGGRHGAVDRRAGRARPAPSSSSSTTMWRPCGRSRSRACSAARRFSRADSRAARPSSPTANCC